MQINRISNNFYSTKNNNINKNVNFNGACSKIGDGCTWFINKLEGGGFAAEFVLMDLCGMVLPRVWQGFNRNKEELGHWNYQAGAEEALREGITGPSLFIIPCTLLALAGMTMGKATKINRTVLGKFSNYFSDISNQLSKTDLVQNQKLWAQNLFDELFTKTSSNLQELAKKNASEYIDCKNKFADMLTNNLNQRTSVLTAIKYKLGLKSNEGADNFAGFIHNINAKYYTLAEKENMSSVYKFAEKSDNKLVSGVNSASELYADARNYLLDVVSNVTKTADDMTKANQTFDMKAIINATTKVRENCRKILCIGSAATLGGFLSFIPKIYQLSKKNPALTGLVEEKKEVKA